MADENILEIKKTDQNTTVDELFKRSQPNPVYYTLLAISSVIIALGILLENSFIVIGGMLLTPVLSPILLVALGLAIGEPASIKNVGMLIAKSVVIIVLSALILTFIFGAPASTPFFENTTRTAILYFIVALASGVAATFAWVRKEMSDILPGIAIAVSLVPPLSLVGIGIASWAGEVIRFYFFVFLLNSIGVIVGSLVVFSLLKFHKSEKRIQQEAQKIEKKSA